MCMFRFFVGQISADRKSNVEAHLNTGVHKSNAKCELKLKDLDTENPAGSFNRKTQLPIQFSTSRGKQYKEDICHAFGSKHPLS
jgi:hypothetical protein